MTRAEHLWWAALLTAIWFCTPTSAKHEYCSHEPGGHDTVEWMAWAADVVVTARVEREAKPADEGVHVYQCTAVDTLKGKVAPTFTFRSHRDPEEVGMGSAIDRLLFLKHGPAPQPDLLLREESDVIPVDGPVGNISGLTGDPVDGPQVLRMVRAELATVRRRAYGSNSFGDSMVSCFTGTRWLSLPPGAATLDLAKRWASDPDPCVRFRAVAALDAHPGSAGAAILRELLADPFMVSEGEGRGLTQSYPVRSIAYRLLESWGISVPAPVLEIGDLYRPVQHRMVWWAIGAASGGMILWRLIHGPGPFRPPPLRCTAALCRFTLALAGVLLAAWPVSYFRYDQLAGSNSRGRFELCSAQGKLRLTQINTVSTKFAADLQSREGWIACRPNDGLSGLWDVPPALANGAAYHCGGILQSGFAFGGKYAIYDWQVLMLSHWLLATVPLLLAFSLHWLTARAVRIIYAWRRICWTCGYDMRATPDRCPECGTVIPGHVPTPARVMRQLEEQKREEQELRQAEEKYHDALAAALDRMTKQDEPPK